MRERERERETERERDREREGEREGGRESNDMQTSATLTCDEASASESSFSIPIHNLWM